MDLGIQGKVAMVAAASKGIGLGIARVLLREGAAVSICGRGREALDAARGTMLASWPEGRVLAVQADVSSGEDLERWHAETVAALGEVDILVTNTGGPPAARFEDLSEEQWHQGIESTLMNVVRLTRLVLPAMKRRRAGCIVHLTSLVAKQPMPLLTISSTLRAGISALTKTMSLQFARDGIRVNALLPGHVWTDRQAHLVDLRAREEGIDPDAYAARTQAGIPLGRFGRADEMGDVVAFLVSERASYLTGVSLQVDGGATGSTF